MPTGKSSRDILMASLWFKSSLLNMSTKGDPPSQTSEISAAPLITQDYMAQLLNDIKQEIGSLQTDFKTCIQDLCRDVAEVGTHVDNLERTVDSRMEDQEILM
ncbi:hypothetical protein NDU88_004026 [Pleurodeles waltl]|uniref:Heat shock factor binding protein 1 n=1 Tax=Pleurodeles waltl TaxID=8319 RepID=A0AAV7V050_PLEWA|nr:hypothetical protein NDU88_004026 [Pleurodeles waltl]